MNPLDELSRLTELFPTSTPLIERAEHVAASLTPEPFRRLLVLDEHMTVTMEAFHGAPVDVQVLAERRSGEIYARQSLLLKAGTERVVQFGIMRFNLNYVTEPVRKEILDGRTPLGRILINYNVLRHIDLGAVLRIWTGPGLQAHFRCNAGSITYGRLATIFCNHEPAVDLLEITAPIAPS
jgi:chorismate-pyruvate lyase